MAKPGRSMGRLSPSSMITSCDRSRDDLGVAFFAIESYRSGDCSIENVESTAFDTHTDSRRLASARAFATTSSDNVAKTVASTISKSDDETRHEIDVQGRSGPRLRPSTRHPSGGQRAVRVPVQRRATRPGGASIRPLVRIGPKGSNTCPALRGYGGFLTVRAAAKIGGSVGVEPRYAGGPRIHASR